DFSGEDRLVAQIFGAEPAVVAEGALMLQERGAGAVDINAGCPVPKVVKTGAGSELMRNPELLNRIVCSVVQAVKVPVTVKIRTGWNSASINAVEVALAARDGGAAAVAVHGRTCRQMYGGQADWDVIAEVTAALDIPVIGNGDIAGPEEAARRLDESGCAGVMIGRACLGNPWIFGRIAAFIRDGRLIPEPSMEEKLSVAREHLIDVLQRRGELRGIREMRKHLAWYFKGLPGAARLREEINAMSGRSDAEGIFTQVAAHSG
ncbi:MAG: tRNA dihydrouridine synthase DusB, partial [bacterium]|nr:tRNA dihydrouridine synthase DusB [bacterium]